MVTEEWMLAEVAYNEWQICFERSYHRITENVCFGRIGGNRGMAELLTRAIVEEYRKRAKALPDTAGQDIRERRELRIELQNRCGITELQAVNILNGFHADSYIVSEYRKAAENASEKAQDHERLGKRGKR